MTESQVNSEIVASLKHFNPESWVYKIPDTPGPTCSPKPFDIIFLKYHTCGTIDCNAIETKLFKSYKSLSINDLQPSQIKGLREFESNNVFHSFVFAVYKFYDKNRKRISELYRIPVNDLIEKKLISYKDLGDKIEYRNGYWQLGIKDLTYN